MARMELLLSLPDHGASLTIALDSQLHLVEDRHWPGTIHEAHGTWASIDKPTVSWHVALFLRDANLDGILDAETEWRAEVWVGNTHYDAPQQAFNVDFKLRVGGKEKTAWSATPEHALWPTTIRAAIYGGASESFTHCPPVEWGAWVRAGGPSPGDPLIDTLKLDAVFQSGFRYGKDLAAQHTTGLDDQWPSTTPGEMHVALGMEAHVLYDNLCDRVVSECEDPSYLCLGDGSPFDPRLAEFEHVDFWEAGPTSHRRTGSETYGWDKVGGPKSPKGGYSAEHFDRSVNALFDFAIIHRSRLALWMLSCKLGAITSYGWPEFSGETADAYPWSARAWAKVGMAFLRMWWLTEDDHWIELLEHNLATFEATLKPVMPDGVALQHGVPSGPRAFPTHGHGTFAEGWLRNWACVRPDGPQIAWDAAWSHAFEDGATGEQVWALMQPALQEAGLAKHGDKWWYAGTGSKASPASYSWDGGIAYQRYASSTCIWMTVGFYGVLVGRILALPDGVRTVLEATAADIRDGLLALGHAAAFGHEGLMPESTLGFHRDIAPRQCVAIPEFQSDFALARVTAEGVAWLGAHGRKVDAAARSVYLQADRAKLSDSSSVVGREFWAALRWGIRP